WVVALREIRGVSHGATVLPKQSGAAHGRATPLLLLGRRLGGDDWINHRVPYEGHADGARGLDTLGKRTTYDVLGECFAVTLGLGVTVAVGTPRPGHVEGGDAREHCRLPYTQRGDRGRAIRQRGGKFGALASRQMIAREELASDVTGEACRRGNVEICS